MPVGKRATVRHLRVCVCVCVCVCARARALAHVHMCTSPTLTHSVTFVFVCAFDKSMTSFIARPPLFHVWCVNLAVLGTVGGGLASSAHEWLLQRLGAVIAQRGIAALGRCVLRPWHLASSTNICLPSKLHINCHTCVFVLCKTPVHVRKKKCQSCNEQSLKKQEVSGQPGSCISCWL